MLPVMAASIWIARSVSTPLWFAVAPRELITQAGLAVANSMAMARMSPAGTLLIFSAHSGVYSVRYSFKAVIFSSVEAFGSGVTWQKARNCSPWPWYSPSVITTLHIARATAVAV